MNRRDPGTPGDPHLATAQPTPGPHDLEQEGKTGILVFSPE
jgi:hypothetical protein